VNRLRLPIWNYLAVSLPAQLIFCIKECPWPCCVPCSHAYVTCLEIMEASDSRGRILATNIFEKQGGQWKIVHHHGSPVRQLA
jgi:hypothetical protein